MGRNREGKADSAGHEAWNHPDAQRGESGHQSQKGPLMGPETPVQNTALPLQTFTEGRRAWMNTSMGVPFPSGCHLFP